LREAGLEPVPSTIWSCSFAEVYSGEHSPLDGEYAKYQQVIDAVTTCISPFELRLEHAQILEAKIVVVAIERSEELCRLLYELRTHLSQFGLDPAAHPLHDSAFSPCVPIAVARTAIASPAYFIASWIPAAVPLGCRIDALQLVEWDTSRVVRRVVSCSAFRATEAWGEEIEDDRMRELDALYEKMAERGPANAEGIRFGPFKDFALTGRDIFHLAARHWSCAADLPLD